MTILVSIWRSGRLRLFSTTILSRLCHHFQLKSGDVPRREEMPDQAGNDVEGASHDDLEVGHDEDENPFDRSFATLRMTMSIK